MTVFLTSDLHLGHARIQEFQPLRKQGTIQEMNDWIVDNWNATVSPEDEVWVLGDQAMGKIADSLPQTARLNGTKYLVAGNHDRFSPAYGKMSDEKRAEWRQKYIDAGFTAVFTGTVSHVLDGFGKVNLCHFPYITVADHVDEREAQYDRYRPFDDGSVLLHGHVHGAYGAITGTRTIDVGIDVPDLNFAPVSSDVLAEYAYRSVSA